MSIASTLFQIFVWKVPGSITITRTPKGSSSRRRLSEIASKANLDAAYGPRNGRAERPATERMLTIRPRAARSSGRNACVTATAPTRFTSRTRRSSSSGNSSSGPAAGIPALLTRPASGAPASARSTSARAWAMLGWSVTSMFTGVTPACASAAASDSRRTVPNTRKPRPARSRAHNAPMPLEAPVTTTPGVTRANLRPPRQRRRARPQRRIDVAQRDGRRDGPPVPLHRGHPDRNDLSIRPQIDHGRGGDVRTLVRLDDERPGALRRPRPLERVHALPRRLRELELHGPAFPVHDPLRRARYDVTDRGPVMERVHQEERAAHRLVVRVDGELDRDPRRAFCECRSCEPRGRERREDEGTNPGLHGNLQWMVAGEMSVG